LVDRDVIGLQAFDEVLRLGFRGVMSVALHPDVRGHRSHHGASNPTSFRIPFDAIATLERVSSPRTLVGTRSRELSHGVCELQRARQQPAASLPNVVYCEGSILSSAPGSSSVSTYSSPSGP